MPTERTLVSAAEVARLAGVTRATVSNWRRRHPDFPAPVGGSEARPAFDLAQVRQWLAARDQLPPESPVDALRDALREALRAARDTPPERLWPLLLAADRASADERALIAELPDIALVSRVGALVDMHASAVPGAGGPPYRPDEAEVVRRVVQCVHEAGAEAAADVLAEADSIGGSFGSSLAGVTGRTGGGTAGGASGSAGGGTATTPPAVAALMADLLAAAGDRPPAEVADPACGAGTLLAAAARRGATALSGWDTAPVRAAQAAVRVALAAPSATVDIRVGDSLRADPADPGDEPEVAGVLCNPPYGVRDWGYAALVDDPRWQYGSPPKGEPELAWVQHCLSRLVPGGTAVLLLPPAVAERPGGRAVRRELVRAGAVRGMVALPPGTAPPLHVGLHLWLVTRPAGPVSAPAVLFVDATGVDGTGSGAGDTAPAAASTSGDLAETDVVAVWRAWLDDPQDVAPQPGYVRGVAAVDLLDEEVDLSPVRRVRSGGADAPPEWYADHAEALRSRLQRATGALADVAGGAPWPVPGAEARQWRTATVADLLRGGAVTLLRPGRPRGGDPTAEEDAVTVASGDVLLAEMLRTGAQARVAGAVEVGGSAPAGHSVLRPDPARFDPWFLAGFLSAEENVHTAATGTSAVRVDPRKLRVPMLPLAEQQRYGRAFRRLAAMRTAAELAGRLADETARHLATGLTSGALLPPGPTTDHVGPSEGEA